MPHDITIPGPAGELRIFPSGDFYFWNVLNDGLCGLRDVQLRINSFQSFNFNKQLFREPTPFNCPWRAEPTLAVGDQTKDQILVRFEGDNIGFGNGNGMYLLPCPTGDPSTTRRWRLNMRVDGFSEPWPIVLDLGWTMGTKTIELHQADLASQPRKQQPDRAQNALPPRTKNTAELAELQRELGAERDRETLQRKLVRDCLNGTLQYPKSLYNSAGRELVVFGLEEHIERRLEGWVDEPPLSMAGTEQKIQTAASSG